MFSLNAKQLAAVEAVKNRKNVLITGPAGTGKTIALNAIVAWARENVKEIGVTASTGLAAFLIKGRTLHSFLGIGLAKHPVETLVLYAKKRPQLIAKLRKLRLLIIDEVSMIDKDLLDKISDYMCRVINNTQPFGGVQIVLCGDFCQLPPVNGDFCFKAEVWTKADITMITLEELMRQEHDIQFQQILNEIRWGTCSKATLRILNALKNTTFDNGILPTKLFATNKDVDKINELEYNNLVKGGAKVKIYKTKYASHASTEQWASTLKIPNLVNLCVGAQVIVSWNIQTQDKCTLVNGTRGIVLEVLENAVLIATVDGKEYYIDYTCVVCEENESMFVQFMPLRLAFALSIHKSQGMTLDAVQIDLGESIFEYGQAYVALSRARTLDSIKLISVKRRSFKTNPDVMAFYGIVVE